MQAKLETYAADVSNPASPNFHRFLTENQFIAEYSPSESDYGDFVQFLQSANSTVVTSGNRLTAMITLSPATIESLLGTQVWMYKQGNGEYFAPRTPPQLPCRFANLVRGIIGLENLTSIHSNLMNTMPDATAVVYSPQQMRSAYGVSQLQSRGYDGTGQSMVIVDAYGSSTLSNDLTVFANQYGITRAHGSLYYPSGLPASQDSGWAGETTVDVEWASVMAPRATINLVISSDATGLYNAVNYAVSNSLGNVMSLSWGSNEFTSETSVEEPIFAAAVARGIAVFASSGDCGAYQSGTTTRCDYTKVGVSYPASSAYVTAVGGTSLYLNSLGLYKTESAWSGSGGGISAYISKPSWQTGSGVLSGGFRVVPDVAMDADPSTGVPIYVGGYWYSGVGGTSLAAPMMAATYTIANQMSGTDLGFASPLIYRNARGNAYNAIFHDVTTGSNGQYNAGVGWNAVAGWGSPNSELLSASLSKQLRQVTVSTYPAGLPFQLTIDNSLYSSPSILYFASGSNHVISTNSTVPSGTNIRNRFASWAGLVSGASPTSTFSITQNQTLVIQYVTQYYLPVVGGGQVVYIGSQSGDGWYDAGSLAQVQSAYSWNVVTGQSRLNLVSYSIDSGTLVVVPRAGQGVFSTNQLQMNAPHTISFGGVVQYYLSIIGGNVTASSSPTSDKWYDSGTSATVSTSCSWNVVPAKSRQNLIAITTDGSTSPFAPRSGSCTLSIIGLTMNTYHSITFASVTQYSLNVVGGNNLKFLNSQTSDSWYDAGTTATLQTDSSWGVPSQVRNLLTSYQIDQQSPVNVAQGSAATVSLTIPMSTYHNVKLNALTQFFLSISGGNGLSVSPIPPTNDNWYNNGTTVYISTNYIWNVSSGSSRTSLTSYDLDNFLYPIQRLNSGALQLTVQMITYHNLVFNSIVQYHLTASGGYQIVVQNSQTNDNWFDSGSQAQILTAAVYGRSLGTGLRVSGFVLDGATQAIAPTTSTVSVTIRMNTPHTIVFNSITQYQVLLDSGAQSGLLSITQPTVSGDNYWYDGGSSVVMSLHGVWNRNSTTGVRLVSFSVNNGTQTTVKTTGGVTALSLQAISSPQAVATSVVQQFYLATNSGSVQSVTPPTINDDLGWYDSGTSVQIAYYNVWNTIANQSRLNAIALAVDGGAASPIQRSNNGTFVVSLIMTSSHAVSVTSATQYHLGITGGHRIVKSASSPTRDEWYDKGTQIAVSTDYTWNAIPQTSRENLVSYSIDGKEANVTREEAGTFQTPAVVFDTYHQISFSSVTQFFIRFVITNSNGVTKVFPISMQISTASGLLNVTGFQLWLDTGTKFTIASLIWEGSDVRPLNYSVVTTGPLNATVKARIYDVHLRVTDAIGLPNAGASVKFALVNGTSIERGVPIDGTVVVPLVPLGNFSANVSNAFGSKQLAGDASIQTVTTAELPIGYPTIVLIAAIVMVLFFVGRRFAFRRPAHGDYLPEKPRPENEDKPSSQVAETDSA